MIYVERFHRHTEPEPNSGCLLWIGARFANGYGRVRLSTTKTMVAHRLAWILEHGLIPAGLCACHRCDTRPCVNTDHLFLGTNHDNILDCVAKGRRARLAGVDHPMAKLRVADVLAIRTRFDGRESITSIAPDFGVTPQMVHRIGKRKNWSHV